MSCRFSLDRGQIKRPHNTTDDIDDYVMKPYHLQRCAALSGTTECERYWEDRGLMSVHN